MGSSFSNFSDSMEIELISARPGYRRSAASSTSTWLESMDRGREVTPPISVMACSIISFSSMPLIPILMSSTSAPQASCSWAKPSTRSRSPSRSFSCSLFLPVGLIRSPTTINVSSNPKERVLRSLVRYRTAFFCLVCTFISFVQFTSSFIYSGSVPQQPPSMEAPARTSPVISFPNVSASIS